MFREVLLFLNLLKVIRVDVGEIDEIFDLFQEKTLYTEKYHYPNMTHKIECIYKLKSDYFVNTRNGPYILAFFNNVVYYEWFFK